MNEYSKPNYDGITADEIERALKTINADDYNTWRDVGMALHDYTQSNADFDGFAVYDEWSKTSSKYVPGETQHKWNSFKAGKGATIGTVIYYARQNGFKFKNEELAELYSQQGIITQADGTQIHVSELKKNNTDDYAPITTPTTYADRIAQQQAQQKAEEEQRKKQIAEDLKDSNVKNTLNGFIEYINKPKTIYSTGFTTLDKYLNGGFMGGDITLFGGETGTGKTYVLLQMAENIVKAGNDVIYITLEISKFELIARSLSRMTFVNGVNKGEINNFNVANVKTINGKKVYEYSLTKNEILHFDKCKTNKSEYLLENAIEEYKNKIASHLYILEAEAVTTVDYINDFINGFIEKNNKKPVVFIDYMQLIKPSEAHKNYTEKQHIDYCISVLKKLAIRHEIPIVMISSINRQSYGAETNNSAFKGSGDLEYTASTTLLMNYRYFESVEYFRKPDSKSSLSASDIKLYRKAVTQHNRKLKKSGDAIELEMKIVKNRHGIDGITINFDFYGQHGLFIDKGEQGYTDYKTALKEYKAEYDAETEEENEIQTFDFDEYEND